MTQLYLSLGGSSYGVTTGVVTVFFIRLSLDVTHITVFLASVDEFPFYIV